MMPPDRMGEEKTFECGVKNIRHAINLCRTAELGRPSLHLRPANRQVFIKLDFVDKQTVSLSLPLMLVKQQKAKPAYLKFFAEKDIEVLESIGENGHETLSVSLDRTDENMGQLITEIYQFLFDASDVETVKGRIKTLKSDWFYYYQDFGRVLSNQKPDYKMKSASARHKGRPAWQIQLHRVFTTGNLLIYPILVTLSYGAFGVMGMCWAVLAFLGFFAIYSTLRNKKPFSAYYEWSNGAAMIFITVALIKESTVYLQSVPTAIGATITIFSAIEIIKLERSHNQNTDKKAAKKYRQDRFNSSLWMIGGVGLALVNEWLRRNLALEEWVWFFAFFRVEFMAAMIVVAVPALIVFLKREEQLK